MRLKSKFLKIFVISWTQQLTKWKYLLENIYYKYRFVEEAKNFFILDNMKNSLVIKWCQANSSLIKWCQETISKISNLSEILSHGKWFSFGDPGTAHNCQYDPCRKFQLIIKHANKIFRYYIFYNYIIY